MLFSCPLARFASFVMMGISILNNGLSNIQESFVTNQQPEFRKMAFSQMRNTSFLYTVPHVSVRVSCIEPRFYAADRVRLSVRDQVCKKGLKWEMKDRKKFYFFTSNLYPSNNYVDIVARRCRVPLLNGSSIVLEHKAHIAG